MAITDAFQASDGSSILPARTMVPRLILIALVAFTFSIPLSAYAACSFMRDLTIGLAGEDVRCLQEYLETSGYGTITTEYGWYGPMTQRAVERFQETEHLSPANGVFGLSSRIVYALRMNILPSVVSHGSTYVPSATSAHHNEQRAFDAILRAFRAIHDARLKNMNVDEEEEELLRALDAFTHERYTRARDLAESIPKRID